VGEAFGRAFAVFLMLLGASSLAGWATAFRNRFYLAGMGVTFLALGGALLIPPKELAALRILLWVIAGGAFVVSLWLAIGEVKRELAAILEQRRGLEQQMQEYLAQLQAQEKQSKDG